MTRRDKTLTVIAVLLIAAAVVAWPLYYRQQRNAARDMSCKLNVVGLATALNLYVHDHGGRLPTASGQDWALQAARYLGSLRELRCPSDDRVSARQKQLGERAQALRGREESLLFLRNRGIRLTSYEMPRSVAGRRVSDLHPDTLILEETGPGHQGKHHLVLARGNVIER